MPGVVPVVEVDEPVTSDSGPTTEALVGFTGAALEVEAAAVGISTLGWITVLRTRATAPQEKARAIVTASAQPAASFIHFGMTQLSQVSR